MKGYPGAEGTILADANIHGYRKKRAKDAEILIIQKNLPYYYFFDTGEHSCKKKDQTLSTFPLFFGNNRNVAGFTGRQMRKKADEKTGIG